LGGLGDSGDGDDGGVFAFVALAEEVVGEGCLSRHKRICVTVGDMRDIALVDAAATTDAAVASRAVWDPRRLVAFMVTEVVVAFVSGSLALLSDAGHMLTDAGAIGASLWAIRLAARPAADLDPLEVFRRLSAARTAGMPPLTVLERWDRTQQWVGVIRRLVGLATRLGIDELFFELMASTGYLEVATFETASEQAQVAANLAKFGELIDGFCDRRRDHSLGAFMAYLELVLLSETDEEVAQGEEVESAVQVMTIHQAKGLEFDAVFVPALVEGRLPQPHRGDRFRIPAQLAGEAGGREDQVAEERRLLYVAMTRARDRLLLSWADSYEGSRAWRRSRFVDEIEAAGRRHFKWTDIPALGAALAAPELRLLELGEEVAASAAGPPPSEAKPRLSFSGISTYRECPRQYQFRYIHRLPVASSAEAQYGNILHAALQRLGKLRMEQPEVTVASLELIHEQVWEEMPFTDPRRLPALRALGRRQLLSYLQAGGFGPRPALLEEPFTVDLDGWRLRGIIDRVDPPPVVAGDQPGTEDLNGGEPAKQPGRWRIIDYKTGDPIPASRLRRDLQLALYGLGAKRALGLGELDLEIVYLKDSSRVMVAADDDLLAEAERIGSEVAAGVAGGSFEPRPERRRCALCAYRLACSAAL